MGELPYIVGIGASAGGLQALKYYFFNRKKSAGEAYVVILHSLKNAKSKLVDLLKRETEITVKWITFLFYR